MTQTPVAILTSGALLNSPRVRRTCALADVVLPTVTTTDPDVFQRIHRPASSLHVDDLWTGLRRFRQEYDGLTWLEVMLIPGINTDDASVEALSDAIAGLKPDRIQLNTPVRPTAEPDLHPLSAERLARIGEMLGPKAEVIADFDGRERVVPSPVAGDEVLALVSRRPCQLEDVASGLGIHPHEALKVLASLIQASRVKMHVVGDKRYFEATFAGS
jgi:wyosine [tRNA(Phe)-imidazoG37] synthetase (radical SAM superfamily)